MSGATGKHDRDRLADLYLQVQAMARSLAQRLPPAYMVLLSAYTIAGEVYPATALTVSLDATRNFAQTPDGFECDALFPVDQIADQSLIDAAAVRAGVINIRLTVRLQDIMEIIPLS